MSNDAVDTKTSLMDRLITKQTTYSKLVSLPPAGCYPVAVSNTATHPSLLMKRTDLYKNLASKIDRDMKQAGSPDRFGQAAVLDRKEQRKLDQAKGLIPFAVKLDAQLAEQLRTLAEASEGGINEVVDTLLRKGLAAGV